LQINVLLTLVCDLTLHNIRNQLCISVLFYDLYASNPGADKPQLWGICEGEQLLTKTRHNTT